MRRRELLVWILFALCGFAYGQQTVAPFVTTSANAVLYASSFPGADAGAKINAADLQLGAAAGTIIYNAAVPATASTNVTLSSNHKLILQSPITWTAAITFPTSSSGQDVSCPSMQTLNYGVASTWISGTSVSNILFHDCTFSGTITTGTLDMGASFVASTGISLQRNTVTNAYLVSFNSSANSYAAVNAGNSTSSVEVIDNTGKATGVSTGQFIYLGYTNGASVSNNVASGFYNSIEWWGGDACLTGCSAGGNGALSNPRKTTNLAITGNVFSGVRNAGIWGSMGQYIAIAGNVVTGLDTNSTDVGIDAEGSWDVTATGNAVFGFANGDMTTFFYSTRVSFSDNKLGQDTAAYPLIATYNSSNLPSGLTLAFTGNDLNCSATTVCTNQFQAAEKITFSGNHLYNTNLPFSGSNTSQILVTGNDLTFTVTSPYGIYATSSIAGSQTANANTVVRNNVVVSSIAQSAGTRGIYVVGTDFNNANFVDTSLNIFGGIHPFPIDIECDAGSANAGQSTFCSILNNTLASNSIVNANAGSGATVVVQQVGNVTASSNQTYPFSVAPTMPTQSPGDNSNKGANTGFVTAAITAAQTSIVFISGTITNTALSASCESVSTSVTGALVGSPVIVSTSNGTTKFPYTVEGRVAVAGTVIIEVCGTGTPTFTTFNAAVMQ